MLLVFVALSLAIGGAAWFVSQNVLVSLLIGGAGVLMVLGGVAENGYLLVIATVAFVAALVIAIMTGSWLGAGISIAGYLVSILGIGFTDN